MTSPTYDPNQPQSVALSGQILSPADHAVFGGRLGAAGFTAMEISELMGKIEREATVAAMSAARQVALSIANQIVATVERTHYNAAATIHQRICDRNGGTGGIGFHRRCAQIALDVAHATPSHVPPPAQPIIGSPR